MALKLVQFSDFNWDHVLQVVKQQLGAGKLDALDEVVGKLFPGVSLSDPKSFSNFTTNLGNIAGVSISDLKNNMDDAVKKVVVSTLSGMVPRVISALLPGASGLTAIYNGAQFLLNNASRLNGLLDGFFNALKDVEGGHSDELRKNLGKLLDGAIPLGLSFLASQVGLGQLPTTLRSALSYVPNQVDAAIRKAVASLVASGKGAAGGGTAPGPSTGSAAKSVSFTYQNRSFRLSVTPPAGQPKVKLEETTGGTSKLLGVVTAATLKGDQVTIGHLGAIEAAATALFQSTRRAPGTPAAANALNPLPNQT